MIRQPATDTWGANLRNTMDAHHPPRFGYCYRKGARTEAQRYGTRLPAYRRLRLLGLAWRVQPLYYQAGRPFGSTDAGLLLWIEFGRRSGAN